MKINEVRAQIASSEGKLSAPEHSGMSRAELRETLIVQIDAWHDHATELIADGLRKMAAGDALDLLVSSTHGYVPESLHIGVREQALDTRAWLTFAIGKETMFSRFEPLLGEMPEGLDAATRAQHLADITRQIVTAELFEEELIRKAEGDGVVIDPRPGQRPEAAILIGWGI